MRRDARREPVNDPELSLPSCLGGSAPDDLRAVAQRLRCGLGAPGERAAWRTATLGHPEMARLHAIPWEYLRAVEDGHFLGLS
jgi:hypothetical protein